MTAQKLYAELPLYSKQIFEEKDRARIISLLDYEGTIDLYCPDCNRESTFTVMDDGFPKRKSAAIGMVSAEDPAIGRFTAIVQNKYIHKVFACARNSNHTAEFSFLVTVDAITKIGQYPSLADLFNPEIGKYRKILGDKYRELNRAVGLFPYGVGIGSFVYLRRIFEGLIVEAHQRASSEPGWDEDAYQRARVIEKIPMLKTFLPDILVDNGHIYSVLSKGIHELDENECLEFFPVIKAGIELILDEKIAQQEKEAKTKTMQSALGGIMSRIK